MSQLPLWRNSIQCYTPKAIAFFFGIDNIVQVWDVSTGAELNVLKGHTDYVNTVAISRDGMKVVSSSLDKTVRVWDVKGAELNVLRGYTGSIDSVAIPRDGMRIDPEPSVVEQFSFSIQTQQTNLYPF